MKRLLASFILVSSILSGATIAAAEPVIDPSLLIFVQDVKSAIRQAQARYDSGNVSGAADLARKILAKYPDNAEAKAILEQCIATEREDYEKALGSLSVSELTAFQKKYPNSDYNNDVNKRIADLPFWLEAKEKDTIDSYKKYLSESVHQMYKRNADFAIAELTVKEAYDAAVASNTIAAFEQFRSMYPNSRYDKDASNKIARLMADQFTSRSTYTDKNNALAYAKNEMTRDYVNNKFNKATEKKSGTSSSSSVSSYSSGSYASRSVSPSYGTYRTSASNPPVMFGLETSVEWIPDNTVLGIGPILRFGRYQAPIFATIAAKYSYASYKTSYTDYSYGSYYGYNEVTVHGKGNYLSIPITVNWDMCASMGVEPGFYFGVGYVYNKLISTPSESINNELSSWLLQMGICGRHWDFKYGVSFYSDGFSNSNYVDDTIMVYFGLTYFF